MNPLIQLKQTTAVLLATFWLASFALSPAVKAVSPPPDGGYPNFNTAEGDKALFNLTTGAINTALGWRSLFSNSTGNFNTGVGAGALVLNTADSNTAVGAGALLLNTAGTLNAATGSMALFNNSTGRDNTAAGANTLFSNTTGADDTAIGFAALGSNVTGSSNTAIGSRALIFNTADANTAVGFDALQVNTTGSGNVAVGNLALINNNGNANVALGVNAGFAATTGFGNVYIGADVDGVAGESAHTYIRNINATSVSGGGADTVTVDLASGLLGHLSSSRRYKERVQPMNDASETLYRLKPVTYCYKKEIDRTQSPAFGLIAEDVAAVSPALVANDSAGQPESIHYEMVNAMLLNEFLKEHQKVEKLEATVATLIAAMKHQAAEIQKVSAQLEVGKAAPQTVSNN